MSLWLPLRVLTATAVVNLLAACQSFSTLPSEQTPGAAVVSVNSSAKSGPVRTGIDVQLAWGGELRCSAATCRLVSVEHEKSTVVVYEIQDRMARFVDRQPLAYHPDSAIWLADDVLVAAVEGSVTLDMFQLVQGRLKPVRQINVGFSPRDVKLVASDNGRFRLLATPYAGKNVAWVDFAQDQPEAARVQASHWCEAPWHPVRVQRAPSAPAGGVVAACLDDKRVVFAPDGVGQQGEARTLFVLPGSARLVPRHARPSPSGKWLYVAVETGGRNFRFNMDSGELQPIVAPQPVGTVSVLPLADDLVIWGLDSRLHLQRIGDDGTVQETRTIPTDGFSTGLQLIDADHDGVMDLVVHNSAALPGKMGVEIIYGPLWEQAQPQVAQ